MQEEVKARLQEEKDQGEKDAQRESSSRRRKSKDRSKEKGTSKERKCDSTPTKKVEIFRFYIEDFLSSAVVNCNFYFC